MIANANPNPQPKLVIDQIDPTTVCGNMCGHCGDSRTMHGVHLPLEDILTILESNEFGFAQGSFDSGRTLILCGGGDPTYYNHDGIDFAGLLSVLSDFVTELRVFTGGLNPTINADTLYWLRHEIWKGKGLGFNLTYHPFGPTGYEERIKKTLEALVSARLTPLLKIYVFSEQAAAFSKRSAARS